MAATTELAKIHFLSIITAKDDFMVAVGDWHSPGVNSPAPSLPDTPPRCLQSAFQQRASRSAKLRFQTLLEDGQDLRGTPGWRLRVGLLNTFHNNPALPAADF